VLAGILLVLFNGVTDNLIPLFAIGAFLAFSLSQAGMVAHWKRTGGPGALRSMLINGLGAVVTTMTLLVVLVAKFAAGAWVSALLPVELILQVGSSAGFAMVFALLIAAMVLLMLRVRDHYDRVAKETATTEPLALENMGPPIVVLPIQGWSKTSQRALQFALTLSPEIHAVHVATEEETDVLERQWCRLVEKPVEEFGGTPPSLITLPSPYRLLIRPIVEYVLEVEKDNPGRQIAVIVPEMVERHWYHYPLHNQRAEILKAFLLLKGSPRIVLINVPWYLKA
jgi:hypothetical protein